MVAEFHHPTAGIMKTVGLPCKLSDTPGGIRLPPPLLGQHTREVLSELGYDINEVQAMFAQQIVA